ncbi:N-(5'-phosphoribosyl)anthranilate isomerase [Corynebacterium glaucum]|uniref:N-(5'-phosphoribosyl)anthranilate isomerase n=1 Tax=Corynebacterium glaucum TaxID=187491 RepID=A0A1Q2HYM2_9CORY|nr:phosphoribosylanthranilate isomerase [Corynebacterium glaucum]AQQ15955.1 N-(5'-phosphoribosyl)anthranilate isomerase [Corynebacterium glaucum]WJZ08436.1 N-(5'-phosphoribosyl)anthranilate isomerase [Corynebacterium glaucum]
MNPVIQVAGLHDPDEADLVIQAGANWLGIPLRLPSGNDDLTEAMAKDVVKHVEGRATSVLISYSVSAVELTELVSALGFDAVQLHGDIETSEIIRLRKQLPQIQILKSLIVKENNEVELLETVRAMDAHVDMFLTDTYNPRTGAMGATGIQHNIETSAAIVRQASKPVIIAGGLNPDNVGDAILETKPAGVDAHTGLEGSDGRKDAGLVKEFVSEAMRAFRQIANSNGGGKKL